MPPMLHTLTAICHFCHFAIGKRNIYIFYFPFIYYHLSIFYFSFATWQNGKSGKTGIPGARGNDLPGNGFQTSKGEIKYRNH